MMANDERWARAFWLATPGRGEIRRERLPALGPDQARVRALYSGISRGTERLVFRGEVPPSQFQTMRAPFQEGDFPAPVKYGYCSVGVVEAGPAAWRGRTVFCLHPHQDRYVVPVAALTPIPAMVPPGRAVLAANLETALNVLWDAAPRLGDRVAVIGAGVVGCLIARLAGRLPGCAVQLIDIDPAKADIATRLGVGFATPDAVEPEQDCVIHASGSPAGLTTALRLAGFEATVVEASWFGVQAVSLPLGEAFHSRRLTLKSSQVGQVAAAQRGRWDHRRRMATVMELLDDPTWDALIDSDSAFADLPRVLAELSASPGGALCRRIVYPAATDRADDGD